MELFDQALQFNFILAHVPGVENPAADYLSRLDIKPQDRIHLKLHDTIPVQHIEVDLACQTPKQDEEEDDYDPDAQPVPDDQRYEMTQAEEETVWRWSQDVMERQTTTSKHKSRKSTGTWTNSPSSHLLTVTGTRNSYLST